MSATPPFARPVDLEVDGTAVTLEDRGATLLDALREDLGRRGVKDGCSPQGQCGCCTVLIDGAARVACVTPLRRVAGRRVTTIDGLDPEVRRRWADAFVTCGASQCGFCTPGIILRLVALEGRTPESPLAEEAVRSALLAHLCRCTGWQTIVEAAQQATTRGAGAHPARVANPVLASWRASLEGGSPQRVGPEEVLGRAGFADDRAPEGLAVAVPGLGGLSVAADRRSARAGTGRPQGRRSTAGLGYPLEIPEGNWALRLRTTWVEPGYLEPDASWSLPGRAAASPLANGGAFGGKRASPARADAAAAADDTAEGLRVLWSREDVVRQGPKRPPMAAGIDADGRGVIRVASTTGSDLSGWVARVRQVLPLAEVEVVEVAGPVVSSDPRAAGWAEAQVLRAALAHFGGEGPAGEAEVEVPGVDGGVARVLRRLDESVLVEVCAGEILDAVTLRSYVIGAVHQGLGWVRQEGIAVGADGVPTDLTVRSFGILTATEMPRVEVRLRPSSRWPVRIGDAVFAATAAAEWIGCGLPAQWPAGRGLGAKVGA